MPESVLRCPGCGAPAAPDAASCSYCGSALATITCASCFAPMFVGSRFCAQCGAEAVRTLVEDDRPLHCPRCSVPMQALRLGATLVHECHDCGGLWLDPASLQRLADERETHSVVIGVLASRGTGASVPADTVRYVPCPACGKLMNRMNFARASGVILDVCKSHGVWLDRGELQDVLGFIEGGGLDKARQREREQLAEDQRRVGALVQGQGAVAYPDRSAVIVRSSDPPSDEAIPLEVLAHLLRDVLGLFGS